MCVETRRKMSAQRRKFPQLTANLQIPREPILTIKRSSVGCNDDGNTPDIRVHDIAVDRDDGKHGVLAGRQPAAQIDPECRALAGQRDIGEHDSILVRRDCARRVQSTATASAPGDSFAGIYR